MQNANGRSNGGRPYRLHSSHYPHYLAWPLNSVLYSVTVQEVTRCFSVISENNWRRRKTFT